MGIEQVGDGFIRTGNGLIQLGWAITKGFFALMIWGVIIGGCISVFL